MGGIEVAVGKGHGGRVHALTNQDSGLRGQRFGIGRDEDRAGGVEAFDDFDGVPVQWPVTLVMQGEQVGAALVADG